MKSHATATLLNPFSVFVSITNRGSRIVKYLQMHIWLPRHYTFWDPEVQIKEWVCESPGELPGKFQEFGDHLTFERFVVRLSPETRFYLMPSRQPYELPPLAIVRRYSIGLVPMPWLLEVPDAGEVSGVLMLGCDREGRVSSESFLEDVDMDDLARRWVRFLVRNGVKEIPRWPDPPDFLSGR